MMTWNKTEVPKEEGTYVVKTQFEEKVLLWHLGSWYHPGTNMHFHFAVYGWIGPLPAWRDTKNPKEIQHGP